MEKLCSGGLASSMKDVGKTVKSFPTKHVFTTLLLMLLCMFMPQKGWAAFTYETTTYHFGDAATTEGAAISMSQTSYSGIGNNVYYGETMTYGSTTEDISKFAFLSGNNGWWLRNRTGYQGQYGLFTNQGASLAITNLKAGDKVTITYFTANEKISYVKGAHAYTGTTGLTNVESGTEYTVAQDGDMVIKANNNYTYIYTIVIKTLQTEATYSITTQEDTNNNTRSTTFAFTGEGRLSINTIAVPFMNVQFGSNQNGVIVEGLGGDASNPVSHIPDWNGFWHVWFNGDNNNIPAQGTFYKFIPTARGKLQVKGYLSGGNIYLYEVNESTGTFTQIAEGSGSGAGSISVPTGWATLEKGKTYYLCENPTSPAQNAFLLHEFTFTNEFNMNLGKVLSNGANGGELASVKGATKLDSWSVKRFSSNIKTDNISVSFANSKLSISGIAYNDASADQAGTIILDLKFDAGDATFVVTIPYSAEKGHVWDFYDTRNNTTPTKRNDGYLEIGRYKDTGSQLQIETDNEEWKFAYLVTGMDGTTHDPMYQNAYDMEGDNADMIWETEGLWFETPPYKSCLHNENDVDTHIGSSGGGIGNDHYVGILPGGSFTIPGLQKGDRVLLNMGNSEASGTATNNFYITNACDAIGNSIDENQFYGHGGTQYFTQGGGGLHGSYHFISKGGDMKFTFANGRMAKIYSIKIYRGTKEGTFDMSRGSNTFVHDGVTYITGYQVYNDYNTTDAQKLFIAPHWLGKGQSIRMPEVIYTSGSVRTDESHLFFANDRGYKVFFKSEPGQYGMFRMRVDDMDKTGQYVADYALQNITVGYLQKKNYPYTWDFTDLKGYVKTNIQAERTKVDAYAPKTEDGTNDIEFMNNSVGEGVKAVEQWKEYEADEDNGIPAGYGLHVKNEPYSGGVMWSNGQIYAGDGMFIESSYLSIAPPDVKETYNGGLRICDGGLCVTGGNWRFTIPKVGGEKLASLYVRATPIGSVKAGVVDGTFDYQGEATDGSGDKIYAVKGTGDDITLFFNNVIIRKIAVSQDAKTVNKLGYATESRLVEIDPELMGYMTGTGLKAYTVTGVSYANETNKTASVTLTEIPKANVMGKASSEANTKSHRAYIIYNTDQSNKQVKILDDGFHLFVPDLHDDSQTENSKKKILEVSNGKNLLVAAVLGGTVPQEDGIYTNYLMNYKYTGPDGKQHEGPEAFYRAGSGASLGVNKAYLQLETDKVDPSKNKYAAGAKCAIIFIDEENNTETTSLDGVKSIEILGDNAIYTLSGVKVSKPEKGGIYVKNGKKFMVK